MMYACKFDMMLPTLLSLHDAPAEAGVFGVSKGVREGPGMVIVPFPGMWGTD